MYIYSLSLIQITCIWNRNILNWPIRIFGRNDQVPMQTHDFQRRAANYVVNMYHNTSSVTSMLEELKWPTLEERWQRARLVLMYKIVNGLIKIDATERLVQLSRLSRNMGQHSFQIPSCNTIIKKESFYPRTIRDWNALPTDTATAKSLESFKTHLLD